MEINIPQPQPQKVQVKSVNVYVKVRDSGCYTLVDMEGKGIAEISENYVPNFFPGDHYGDYLILDIDLETGRILNWNKPSSADIVEAFRLNKETTPND